MTLPEIFRWLLEDRRINHLFDNLRNFLICGTVAYLSLHLLRLAGTGLIGVVDRVCSWLGLMPLNLLDGYHRLQSALGRRLSAVITSVYLLLAVYLVLAMTSSKMHAPMKALEKSGHIPFSIFQ